MAKRKKRPDSEESLPESVETENVEEETLDDNQEVVLQDPQVDPVEAEIEEVQVPRDMNPEPVDYQAYNPVDTPSGLCTLINRNNYPANIYFLNGDSTTLSPKQRASFPRSLVNTSSLPQGVSCL